MTNNNLLDLTAMFADIQEHWQPVIINHGDFGFRLVKFAGDFDWHSHQSSDKIILVVAGEMGICFDDKDDVIIKAGQMYVLNKGIRHKPYAIKECSIVLIEKAGLGD